MCKNFKLLCCAAYILIVSMCLSRLSNLWCSAVFSAEFCSFRKNSANPDISRKKLFIQPAEFLKNPAEGSSWLRLGLPGARAGESA